MPAAAPIAAAVRPVIQRARDIGRLSTSATRSASSGPIRDARRADAAAPSRETTGPAA
jgi:hypothetical protein